MATVFVVADLIEPAARGEYGQALYGIAQGGREVIEARIRGSVSANLGPEFYVEIELLPGSLTVMATIILAGSVVMTYGSLRQGLQYVREDAERVVQMIFDAGSPEVVEAGAHVELGPEASKFTDSPGPSPTSMPVRQPSMIFAAVMASLVTIALLTLLLVVVLVKVL